MLMRFDMNEVKELVEWNKGHTQKPSSEDLFNEDYYLGGVVTMNNNWPDQTKLIEERLPRSLHLVKDHGLYLMAGTKEHLPSRDPLNNNPNASHVVYAIGCDPRKDRNFYERSRAAFGGDDGVCSLPIDSIEEVLKHNPSERWLHLDITPTSLAIYRTEPSCDSDESHQTPSP